LDHACAWRRCAERSREGESAGVSGGDLAGCGEAQAPRGAWGGEGCGGEGGGGEGEREGETEAGRAGLRVRRVGLSVGRVGLVCGEARRGGELVRARLSVRVRVGVRGLALALSVAPALTLTLNPSF
jgi:hypothetical protein